VDGDELPFAFAVDECFCAANRFVLDWFVVIIGSCVFRHRRMCLPSQQKARRGPVTISGGHRWQVVRNKGFSGGQRRHGVREVHVAVSILRHRDDVPVISPTLCTDPATENAVQRHVRSEKLPAHNHPDGFSRSNVNGPL